MVRAELEKALAPVAPAKAPVAVEGEKTTEKPPWYLKQPPKTGTKGGTPAA